MRDPNRCEGKSFRSKNHSKYMCLKFHIILFRYFQIHLLTLGEHAEVLLHAIN